MNSAPNVARHPSAPPIAANVIAVASGKGGVGKTWASITLGHSLAKRGRKVLLFDGDLGLANLDIQLGLMPTQDIANVIGGTITIDQAITPFPDAGFDIIAGRSGSGSLATMKPRQLEALREGVLSIANRYDTVILDLAAGLDENVRSMAALAGAILVVTTDEPTAITDAYAFIKVMSARQRAGAIHTMINMVPSLAAGLQTHETLSRACQSFLKMKPRLAGVVRRDKKVAECIRRQTPLLMRHPTSTAADDISEVAANLLDVV